MTPEERHKRLQEIQLEIRKALYQKAAVEFELETLYSEQEQLQNECFDELCPCLNTDTEH